MRVMVYGIRHHGPGSAKNLRAALAEQKPDLVLVEGPDDANSSLSCAGEEDMIPPVALMVYNSKDIKGFSVYPFALFSPEWQAFQYAFKESVPVQFMDLPVSILLGLQQEGSTLFSPGQTDSQAGRGGIQDPLGEVAAIAGFTEVERWWEYAFEQWDTNSAVFQAILELMTEMRMASGRSESRETLIREAYMRKQIRKAIKSGYTNIAVVCGAWHAPVLNRLEDFPVSKDNAVLKGLKKIKTTAAWIPWTYERLSRKSGYRSGVHAPAWYELLFGEREDVAVKWMAQAAHLLRDSESGATSASHVLEASQLANALAVMRGIPVPGLAELQEALVSVMCSGQPDRMEIIKKKLVIGETAGLVSGKAPILPLQKDLQEQVRTSRLLKEYQSAGTHFKELDLRKETNRLGSVLIRRLRLLGLPWGVPLDLEGNPLGSFKERWKLKWEPDFAASLIQASTMGSTIEEAASGMVASIASASRRLVELVPLVEDCLNADLEAATQVLVEKIKLLAVEVVDITNLLEVFPTLVQAFRYGSTRKVDIASLEGVIHAMVPRIMIGLPLASSDLSEDQSRVMFDRIQEMQHSLASLNRTDFWQGWELTLQTLEDQVGISPLIKGLATRLLFDRGVWEEIRVGEKMGFALSGRGANTFYAAWWLEGFLSHSGLLLIHQNELWRVLSTWVDTLSAHAFQELLPVLRRTFSTFSPSESQQLLAMVRSGSRFDTDGEAAMPAIHERATRTLPLLNQIFEE